MIPISARLRTSIRAAALAPLLGAGGIPDGNGSIEVQVEGLRNMRGNVLLCVTRNPAFFPDCDADPDARKLSVPAAGAAHVAFADVPAGSYAIAAIHDENGNRKLDTMLRIPREGFGFSRNPAIRMGPPPFAEARFAVGGGEVRQTLRMKYLL